MGTALLVACFFWRINFSLSHSLRLLLSSYFSAGYTISVYVTKQTRSTQPCIRPESVNRVRALIGWCKGWNIASVAWPVKLEFHGSDTDTDTDILADFRARILARKSACPATSPFSLPRAGHGHPPVSSPTCPPTCPTRALFLANMSVSDERVYTCKRVL